MSIFPTSLPLQDILDAFKKQKGDWQLYERQFLELMQARQIEKRPTEGVSFWTAIVCCAVRRSLTIAIAAWSPSTFEKNGAT